MEKQLIHTPAGVRDLYGAELERKKETGGKLMAQILQGGYQQIQPPMFEFFDIFSQEVGTTPSKDLYKFFDKEGNTLVLRPDFTPSIARCAVKYFLEDGAMTTLRLCYEGNVFTNTSELQGKLKETTQLGAELIGDDSAAADAEIICLIARSLKDCGFTEYTISVGEMDFFKGICEDAALDDQTIQDLRERISLKNYYAAEDLLRARGAHTQDVSLLLHSGDVCTIDELERIRSSIESARARSAVERLCEIHRLVEQEGCADVLSFDLGMLSKYHYYTGMICKAYTYGAGDAIVKGGRYDRLLAHFGKDAPAVGCVFLLDDMMGALAAQGK